MCIALTKGCVDRIVCRYKSEELFILFDFILFFFLVGFLLESVYIEFLPIFEIAKNAIVSHLLNNYNQHLYATTKL